MKINKYQIQSKQIQRKSMKIIKNHTTSQSTLQEFAGAGGLFRASPTREAVPGGRGGGGHRESLKKWDKVANQALNPDGVAEVETCSLQSLWRPRWASPRMGPRRRDSREGRQDVEYV